jgi:endogenous inhibitor of DNA gyrase (YacG/DUF329 family)
MTEELKSCPFCGGAADWFKSNRTMITVKCTKCGAKRSQKVIRYDLEWLKNKCFEHWNTRAESPKLSALRQENEQLKFDHIAILGLCSCVNLANEEDLLQILSDIKSIGMKYEKQI